MTTRLARWLPVLAWMGLIFFLSAQPDFPKPPARWLDALLSITAHIMLFAGLAFLLARAMGERPWPLAFALTMLYALGDEFHQSFVPGRCMDPMDLLWDGIGAGIGLWAWGMYATLNLHDMNPAARRGDEQGG